MVSLSWQLERAIMKVIQQKIWSGPLICKITYSENILFEFSLMFSGIIYTTSFLRISISISISITIISDIKNANLGIENRKRAKEGV